MRKAGWIVLYASFCVGVGLFSVWLRTRKTAPEKVDEPKAVSTSKHVMRQPREVFRKATGKRIVIGNSGEQQAQLELPPFREHFDPAWVAYCDRVSKMAIPELLAELQTFLDENLPMNAVSKFAYVEQYLRFAVEDRANAKGDYGYDKEGDWRKYLADEEQEKLRAIAKEMILRGNKNGVYYLDYLKRPEDYNWFLDQVQRGDHDVALKALIELNPEQARKDVVANLVQQALSNPADEALRADALQFMSYYPDMKARKLSLAKDMMRAEQLHRDVGNLICGGSNGLVIDTLIENRSTDAESKQMLQEAFVGGGNCVLGDDTWCNTRASILSAMKPSEQVPLLEQYLDKNGMLKAESLFGINLIHDNSDWREKDNPADYAPLVDYLKQKFDTGNLPEPVNDNSEHLLTEKEIADLKAEQQNDYLKAIINLGGSAELEYVGGYLQSSDADKVLGAVEALKGFMSWDLDQSDPERKTADRIFELLEPMRYHQDKRVQDSVAYFLGWQEEKQDPPPQKEATQESKKIEAHKE